MWWINSLIETLCVSCWTAYILQVHILPKHPHITEPTHTHPHITQPIKTTTAQNTNHMQQSQYNPVPSVYGHPTVHGNFVLKNFTVTHFNSLHFKTKSKSLTHKYRSTPFTCFSEKVRVYCTCQHCGRQQTTDASDRQVRSNWCSDPTLADTRVA